MDKKDIETKPEEEDSEDFGLNIHYHQEDESTDNIEDYDEDIPFPENWKRESVESKKIPVNTSLQENYEKGKRKCIKK